MAKNVWNATLEPNNNVKQNTFDWTHVNNLTTQIGRITPIQCELVPAKTSFRVKPFPALQLMPMVFPVQTRMRATISYFRYPLRALWKDFKDFEGNFREGLEEPYHDFNSSTLLEKMLGTGKLMDYLGVPTTIVGDYGKRVSFSVSSIRGSISSIYYTYDIADNQGVLAGTRGVYDAASFMANKRKGLSISKSSFSNISFSASSGVSDIPVLTGFTGELPYLDSLTASDDIVFSVGDITSAVGDLRDFYSSIAYFSFLDQAFDIPTKINVVDGEIYVTVNLSGDVLKLYHSNKKPITLYSFLNVYSSIGKWLEYDGSVNKWDVLFSTADGVSISPSGGNTTSSAWSYSLSNYNESSLYDYAIQWDSSSARDITLDTSPYYNSTSINKDKQIKLSAYAARAYEGIYNSVYRDNRNNPYYINGVIQYNQWIPSYDGGADSYPYELRYANWEKDFLTTAVQSPQQGNAPLVGITTYEQQSVVTNESGEPTTVQQTKVAMVDEDGKRYSLEFESDSDELKDVKYVELDNGTTVRSVRSLFDLVTSGISITDLRNVNAYQKFLELNMRKGYSYKEIIEGRFDIKVRYADLLLPEFFGGFSRDINMNAITQTVDKDDNGLGSYKDALGSQAGVGYFRGGTDANIECFCDEESIIMGLLVITPLPVYTQLLPKHFLYRGLLDHFNPEFNNISFQPITYKEVCPIQAYNQNSDSLTDTFGYQRAWYEYCQRYDQAHGLFRTDLSNFLMHRVFDQKPELAQSFLVIDPEQVTDVFSVTQTTDKIYGQILLDCIVKLPVARVAIPRLD
jgi:hypothetical protein